MSKDFTVTITNPERAADFERVFGSTTVYVESPIPQLATVPGLGEQRVYKLDLKLLSREQRLRLENYLSGKFVLTEVEVRDLLNERGMPILAQDCIVTVANPQKWID